MAVRRKHKSGGCRALITYEVTEEKPLYLQIYVDFRNPRQFRHAVVVTRNKHKLNSILYDKDLLRIEERPVDVGGAVLSRHRFPSGFGLHSESVMSSNGFSTDSLGHYRLGIQLTGRFNSFSKKYRCFRRN
jgi:hypothetical protein